MQKYGFTFKTVTIDETIFFSFSPNLFQILIILFKIHKVGLCIYMQTMHELVGLCVCACVCLSSRGTAGKEVVLAGITWFSKGQGFDVVPSVEQQGSCRKAESQP